MSSRSLLLLTGLLLPAALFAQSDIYQINYLSHLTAAGGLTANVINITNAGTTGGTSPGGDICANFYTFDAHEEIQSCCSCYTTPNGLYNVTGASFRNTLTGAVNDSLVVKMTATRPVGGSCDPTAPGGFASGIRAWATKLHALPTGGYTVSETIFSNATLSASESFKLTSLCGFIGVAGSGSGICSSCRLGALAQPKL